MVNRIERVLKYPSWLKNFSSESYAYDQFLMDCFLGEYFLGFCVVIVGWKRHFDRMKKV